MRTAFVSRSNHSALSRAASAAFVAAVMVLAVSLMGCGPTTTPTPTDGRTSQDAAATGQATGAGTSDAAAPFPVAATVEGVQIYEPEITNEVQSLRSSYGLVDDGDWATFLVASGSSAEALRATVIKSFAESVLVLRDIEARGITVSDEEVDARLEEMRTYYDSMAEDGWKQMRAGMGYSSDDAYRTSLSRSMLLEKLQDAVVADVSVDDAAVQSYFESNASAYASKRSSYIALATEEDAYAVKSLIDNGIMTFPEAAAVYSLAYINAYSGVYESEEGGEYWIATTPEEAQVALDETHGLYAEESVWEEAMASAGDRGWFGADELADQSDLYMSTLSALEVGQVSDPVDMSGGYMLIMCTGSYDPEVDGRDLASVDASIAEQVRTDATAQKQQQTWDAYVEGLYGAADIEITPMPEGLPYDVDLSLADTALIESMQGTGEVEAIEAEAASAGMEAAADGSAADATAGNGTSASAAASNGAGESAAVSDVNLGDAEAELGEMAPALEG